MRIPLEHLERPMPADSGYFHYIEPLLEQARHGLVPEIVEPKAQ
jgi:hypothetical protein